MDANLSGPDQRRGAESEALDKSPQLIRADAIRLTSGNTLRFEGRHHGSGVSFFLVDNAPGEGPSLHRHPYTETWNVLAGEATVQIGDNEVVARTGDTLVVQPHTWHGFTNTGTAPLRMICIHASPVMIQEEHDTTAT